MNNNTNKLFVTVGAAFVLVLGVFMATPSQAHAFSLGQLIDPGCFFACSNGGGKTTKIINNSGNYQSPGGTVVTGGSTVTVTSPSPAPSQGGYTYSGGSNNYYYTNNPPAVNTSVYSYNYNPAPVYTYGSTYSYNSQPVYQQTYVQPVYVQQYSPLYVSCSANQNYSSVGSPVTWTAYATGGNGYYTYAWSGSDGFYGNGQYAYFTYQYPGYKTASVTVYSNGQSITQNCASGVSVSGPVYAQPIVAQPIPVPVSSNYNGLDIGCYADPINATVNQPVTWNVEVTGGVGPYSYSWTGTDGLTGAAASVIKFYSTSGAKSAVVTVTTADGRSSVHACSNSITVRSNAVSAPKPAPKPVQTAPAPPTNNGLSAAALFSLSNIPWGWVSILVILVLFATVVYLLFNKTKI